MKDVELGSVRAIPVIYVRRLLTKGGDLSDYGESFPPETNPRNAPRGAVILTSFAPPKSLAHELAHVLLDSGKHADEMKMTDDEQLTNILHGVTKINEAPFQASLTEDQVLRLRDAESLV